MRDLQVPNLYFYKRRKDNQNLLISGFEIEKSLDFDMRTICYFRMVELM